MVDFDNAYIVPIRDMLNGLNFTFNKTDRPPNKYARNTPLFDIYQTTLDILYI